MSSPALSTRIWRNLAVSGVTAVALALHAPTPSATGPGRLIFTVAGGGWSTGVPAVTAPIGPPYSVAVDGSGNLFIGSSEVNRVFKVDLAGTIRVLAGNGGAASSGDGGPALDASLSSPYTVAADAAGRVFIADEGGRRVRRVDLDGTIHHVAGNGGTGASGDGGPAIDAQIGLARGLVIDVSGNLFISDIQNSRVRRVDPSGVITTVAGSSSAGFGGDGGPAVNALLNMPVGLAVDTSGNLFIADQNNHRIRRVDSAGTITTVAGSGGEGFGGDNGPATAALLSRPTGVAIGATGNLLVLDSARRVRQVDAAGIITTVAGTGASGPTGDDGPATSAVLSLPLGIAANTAGHYFIADAGSRRIRRVDAEGIITTYAGTGDHSFSGDGALAPAAGLGNPAGIAVDGAGNMFIADQSNGRIRKVGVGGLITTVAGNGSSGFGADGGQALSGPLNGPVGVVADASGNLFIVERGGLDRIRKVDQDGIISTIAGTGGQGFSGDGGPATAARLLFPQSLALDAVGNLYIADSGNHRIRRVDPAGVITTVAGSGVASFSGDGGQATAATLSFPTGIAVDGNGTLFIADRGNSRIRAVDPNGIIRTVAGTGTVGFSGDGEPASAATLRQPWAVAVDASGDLFISDDTNRVRMVDTAGVITTVAGNGSFGFSGDGGSATSARISSVHGMAVDGSGGLLIADTSNHRIRAVLLDTDSDGVADRSDNCAATSNADQLNSDQDGSGDACDPFPLDPNNDVDSDGVGGDQDNCPTVSNADQADRNQDGQGDACDPNTAPQARSGVVTTPEGTTVAGQLGATDADGEPLTFSIAEQPAHGTVTITNAGTGAFTYAPNTGATGYDPFRFQVSDGAASATASEMVFIVASAPRWPGQTIAASLGAGGAVSNGRSEAQSISASGRYVAFASSATNLVAGDTNARDDIFVLDRASGQVTRESLSSTGAQASSGSDSPAISADGRYLAFTSVASTLVANDTNGAPDIFVRDRTLNQTVRVSVAPAGVQANGSSSLPAISADGRFVAFLSTASNLVTGDTNGLTDIFVHDRATTITTRVNVASDGSQAVGSVSVPITEPALSADGRYVAYTYHAPNLVPNDSNEVADVFVHDLVTRQTERVSVATDGTSGTQASSTQSISADGRFVVFQSSATLVSGDTNSRTDIFVRDRALGQTTRASVSAAGQATGSSVNPSVSADGRYVTFISDAANLVTGDANNQRDTFVHDRATGTTRLVSVASGGAQLEFDNVQYTPHISADGRFVAFTSGGATLTDGDTNGQPDVFVVGGVTVEPRAFDVSGAGQSVSTSVSFVYPGTPWLSSPQVPWITSTGGGSGDGSASLAIAANTGVARNGTALVALQPVTVSQAANHAPVAAADSATTAEDTSVTVAVLLNDTDADSDVLGLGAVTVPAHGTAVANADGTITYTPVPNYNGADTFSYRAVDAAGAESAIATVNVSVSPVNDAPVAAPDAASTSEDTAIDIPVKQNDTDPDGEATTFGQIGRPARGSVTVTGSSLRYVPAPNFAGTDSFTYIIVDGSGASSSAVVSVTVSAVNDAPRADLITLTVVEDRPRTVRLTGFDADGDALTFAIVGAPSHGSLSGVAPVVVYTPADNYNGPDTFTFRAEDSSGASSEGSVTISVVASAWLTEGPDGARIQTLAVSPGTPPVIFAGTNGAGVFRSNDAGGTWVRTSNGLTLLTVNELAIDPLNSQVLYAAATGGLFKSSDGGRSWASSHIGLVPAGSTNILVSTITIDPVSPSTLYAGTEGNGAYKSTNAGASWTPVGTGLNNTIRAFAIDPRNPSRLFAGTAAGPFRSTDAGATWTAVSAGISGTTLAAAIAFSPADSSVLLLSMFGSQQVYRSSDGGDTWTLSNQGLPAVGLVTFNFAFDRFDPAVVYAATNGQVYRSLNAGVSWQYFGHGIPNVTTHDVVSLPDAPGHVLAASDGLGTLERTAAATTWTERTDGLRGVWTNSLAIDPVSPATVYAGSTGGGVFKSVDSGVTWSGMRTGLGRMDISTIGVDPGAPSKIYAATFSGLFRSVNGGASWSGGGSGLVGITHALAFDPSNSTVYAGADGFFKSTNGGVSFTKIGLNGVVVQRVAVNRVDPLVIYAGTGNAGVQKSVDGGTTWTAASSGLPNLQIAALEISASQPEVLYVGMSAGLFRSADGGQTWTSANLAQSIRGLAVSSSDPNVVYAATPSGVYRSTGGGNGWTPLTPGIEGLRLRALAAAPGSPEIYAAGDAGGVLRYLSSANDAPVAVDDQVSTPEDTAVDVRPRDNDTDPDANDTVTIVGFTQPSNGTVTQPGTTLLRYTPAANFHGIDTFTYTVGDGRGGTATGTVTITVTPVNDLPVIGGPDVATTAEDVSVEIRPADNDTDGDGPVGQFHITSVTQPAHGTVTQPGTHTLVYTPAANYHGPDAFTYTITDTQGGTATGTVQITVTSVNDAPTAAGVSVTTAEDTAASGILTAVDAEADPLSFIRVTGGAKGRVTITAAGAFTYVPHFHATGSDSFTFRVSDGTASSNVATVNVSITPANDTPLAHSLSQPILEDTPTVVAVVASDPDGDALTFTVVTPPAHGTLTGVGPALTYTPDENYNGSDTFTFKANDGQVDSATATVSLAVVPRLWKPLGPDGGRVNALALDPANPAVIYAAVSGTQGIVANGGGGVFKSTNRGSTWRPMHQGLTNLAVRAISIDPLTPTTLYAGTDNGVFKSMDAAKSWNPTGTTSQIRGLTIDPTAPATLYASTGFGLIKTVNGGASWTISSSGLSGLVSAIVVDPAAPTTVFAATDGNGVFVSANAGATWTASNSGLSNLGVQRLTIDAGSAPTLYAATRAGVFKSSTGGATWSAASTGLTTPSIEDIAVDRASPSTLYAATVEGIFKTLDGGASWNVSVAGFAAAVLAVNSGTPGEVFAGGLTGRTSQGHSAGGILGSSDGGLNWTRRDAGLTAHDVTALLVDRLTPTTVYAATWSSGLFKSVDGGSSWSVRNGIESPTSIWALAVDPQSPATVYAGTFQGVFKTTDAGEEWASSSSGLNNLVFALAVDPTDSQTVYAGTSNGGVYKSIDGGATWSPTNTGLSSLRVKSLAIDPVNPAIVYAGTDCCQGGGVYRSTDRGATWSSVSSGLTGPGTAVGSLIIDPAGTLYAGTLNGVFKSNDAGGNWTASSSGISNLQITALMVDAAASGSLFAGTNGGGVFMSVNSGATWSPVNDGLPTLTITSLAGASAGTRRIYAGTTGNGAFALERSANDLPVVSDQSLQTAEDTARSVTLTGADADGEVLVFAVVTPPTHGTLSGSGATLSYTPAPNYFGLDSFTFTASDGIDTSAVGTVSIAVTPVEDAPTATGGSLSTPEDTSATGVLSGADPDGQVLSFQIVSNGTKGTATITNPATGAFTYVPQPNVNGADSFTFKVSDGSRESNVAEMTVAIAAIDDAPVVTVGVLATPEMTLVSGRLQAADPEGSAVMFSIASQPAHGTVTITDATTGEFTYLPNAGTIGYQPFTFQASDGAVATSAIQMVFVVADSPRWPGQTVRVSVGPNGAQSNGFSSNVAVSADGSRIAFDSHASTLVVGDTNSRSDIFIHDRVAGLTRRVSVGPNGLQGDDDSSSAVAIAADGSAVAFSSHATNLVPGDTNGRQDMFVHDLTTGVTTRVSVASDGSEANAGSADIPTLTADGRYVLFVSSASNLVANDTNGRDDLFLHDRATGATTRVSVGSGGTQANAQSTRGAMSADARHIVFMSLATDVVPNDTNGTWDAFVHDRVTGVTRRVSVSTAGTQSNDQVLFATISANGRVVAFTSAATNLVAGDTNGVTDAFIHDLVTATTQRASVGTGGFEANAASQAPFVSADGRYVSFNSSATNLSPLISGTSPMFVHDRVTGVSHMVSVASDGTYALGSSFGRITADAQFVAFSSSAGNLVSGDTNSISDIFVVGGVTVDPRAMEVADAGGTAEIATAFRYAGTPWTAVSHVPWITVAGPISPNADGRVTLTVSRNTGPVRTGTVTVSAQTVRVSQAADATPPIVTYTINPAPNGAGWLNANATVTGIGSDPESGVASIRCAGGEFAYSGAQQISFVWSSEGQTTLTCAATNGAGLTGSISFPIRLDKTPPELTILTPGPVTYDLHQVVKAAFQCADPISGFTSCQSTVPYDTAIDTASAGTKTFTVSVTDTAGNPASRSVTYNVRKGTPVIAVTAGAFTYDATPHPASGTVVGVIGEALGIPTFTYNGSPTAPVAAGSYTVVASFAGNANYDPASRSALITITKASTTLSLASSPNPSSFTQPVTLAANVAVVAPGAGVPSGTVQFSEGATVLGSAQVGADGRAVLTTSGLAAGAHTVSANYSGDTNFNGSSAGTISHTVQGQSASTQTSLTASPNPSVLGQAVLLDAVVAPLSGSARPTGVVQFFDGGSLLGTGTLVRVGSTTKAQLTVSSLGAGSHTLTARYDGDGVLAGSTSSPVGHTVYQGTPPTATTTTVSSSPNPSAVGQVVTLTATVTVRRAQPTGMVHFYVNGVEVGATATNAAGTASLQVSGLAVGSHTITAQYAGNATYASSTGSWRHFVQ